MPVMIDGDRLRLEEFLRVARDRETVRLKKSAARKAERCRKTLDEFLETGIPYYGINTGFGALAAKHIEKENLKKLQRNLIRSHSSGVGECLSEEIVRGVMLLRANVLAKGFSGVRRELVQFLIEMLNRGLVPQIPEKGSVGASGDLAPLAHLALSMIGEGEMKYRGRVMPAAEAMKQAGLQPVELQEKEGLALINGTQVMTAIAIFNLLEAEKLARIADIAGALTLEALLGSLSPFADDIQRVRPHPGQAESARNVLNLIRGSPLWKSHKGKGKVQDPYSIRCIPQVHGAIRDTLRFIRRTLEIEANSATENPLIFPEKKTILSGGNFHGEPIALAMDFLGIAITELGNISERRIDRLVNPPAQSGLPQFLIVDNGLNSGFMIVHVTAAALTSENRTLSHPATVDNIPTSANQEDHVSMGTIAARKTREIIRNCRHILAIELMASMQALDFHGHPSSKIIETIKQTVRREIPFLTEDARMDVHLNRMVRMIENDALLAPFGRARFRLR